MWGWPPVTHNRLYLDVFWWPFRYHFTVLQVFNVTLTSGSRHFCLRLPTVLSPLAAVSHGSPVAAHVNYTSRYSSAMFARTGGWLVDVAGEWRGNGGDWEGK